jgi:hypothetical protein
MTDGNASQFIIYQTEDGQTKLDVRFVDETVWLTQALMAVLFSTTPENVLMHLKNIYGEGELDQNSTAKDFLVVRQEGTREVKRSLKQNKVHWAITGQTAAEIIYQRANSSKANMGLTHWRGAKVRKQDVITAKNYLNTEELQALNNLVEQYLVFAEGQAMRQHN